MNIYCHNCRTRNQLVMVQNSQIMSWKNGKPTAIITEFKCPDCGFTIRIRFPVTGVGIQ